VSLLTDRPWEQLSDAERAILSGEINEIRKDLTPEAEEYLAFYWDFWRRPNQGRPNGMGKEYRIWMLLAGRGFGKSRVGAEETRKQIELCERVALVGPTAADVRDVMVEGESGLLSVFPPSQRPEYEPSKRRVTFHNGAIATLFSAEEPDRLRGPQHEWAWIDEPASMPRGEEALSNLLLGLRLGDKPWVLITGTPKRIGWLRALSERADTKVTRGSTYDNVANLAPGFVEDILGRYEGTRLGRQELHAEWLDDVFTPLTWPNPGARLTPGSRPEASQRSWTAGRGARSSLSTLRARQPSVGSLSLVRPHRAKQAGTTPSSSRTPPQ
jgi:phage terminase large subunit-like protein